LRTTSSRVVAIVISHSFLTIPVVRLWVVIVRITIRVVVGVVIVGFSSLISIVLHRRVIVLSPYSSFIIRRRGWLIIRRIVTLLFITPIMVRKAMRVEVVLGGIRSLPLCLIAQLGLVVEV
jgi:hypothetical protein